MMIGEYYLLFKRDSILLSKISTLFLIDFHVTEWTQARKEALPSTLLLSEVFRKLHGHWATVCWLGPFLVCHGKPSVFASPPYSLFIRCMVNLFKNRLFVFKLPASIVRSLVSRIGEVKRRFIVNYVMLQSSTTESSTPAWSRIHATKWRRSSVLDQSNTKLRLNQVVWRNVTSPNWCVHVHTE